MAWLRLDDEVVLNPKVGELKDSEFRSLIALWCYCAKRRNEGLVSMSELSRIILASPSRPRRVSEATILRFIEVGLVDLVEGEPEMVQVKDWSHYQPKDPTAADRMRAYRARNADRNADRNATVTRATRVYVPSLEEPTGSTKRSAVDGSTWGSRLRHPERAIWDRLSADEKAAVVAAHAASTGVRYVRGTHASTYVLDALGTDPVNRNDAPPHYDGRATPSEFLAAWAARRAAELVSESLRDLGGRA